MYRSVSKSILAVVVSVLAVGLAASVAVAHPHHGRRCIAPNGVDDTAELQSALDRCSGAESWCAVTLCRGTFHTEPLRVGDFRGVLRGSRRGRTVIQALPEARVNNNPDGYWQDNPLDPGLDPWPYLVQFIGGRGEVRDLTLEIPTPPEGQHPTRGWTELYGVTKEMAGAILITGRDPVAFDVHDVRVMAGRYPDSFLDSTLLSGVSFRGLIYNPADPGGFPVFPVKGRYRIWDSEVTRTLCGTQIGELDEAEVVVAQNDFESILAVDFLDGSRSRVSVYRNRWDAGFVGVQVILNIDGEPSVDNTFLVARNRGTVGPYGGWGSGVYFVDPWLLPEPGGSTLSVFGNRLTVGTTEEAGDTAVDASGAGRLWVGANRFRGRVTTGLRIDDTSGCRVYWNRLGDLDTGAGPHLDLGPETSECLAVVGQDDIVNDDGTNNQIIRR